MASEVNIAWTFDLSLNAFVLTATKAVAKGEKLFNSYGENDNSHYFKNYGFVEKSAPDVYAAVASTSAHAQYFDRCPRAASSTTTPSSTTARSSSNSAGVGTHATSTREGSAATTAAAAVVWTPLDATLTGRVLFRASTVERARALCERLGTHRCMGVTWNPLGSVWAGRTGPHAV
jgi:hypothetical protein